MVAAVCTGLQFVGIVHVSLEVATGGAAFGCGMVCDAPLRWSMVHVEWVVEWSKSVDCVHMSL